MGISLARDFAAFEKLKMSLFFMFHQSSKVDRYHLIVYKNV
jgi:hypothetical protein